MTPREFREEVFKTAGPDLSHSSLTGAVDHYIETRGTQLLRGHIAECLQLADRFEISSKGKTSENARVEESFVHIKRGQIMISDRRAEAIRPWVQQTRQELFGSPSPPFPSYTDAVRWIEQRVEIPLRPGLPVEQRQEIEALFSQKAHELAQHAQALGAVSVSIKMERTELHYAKPGAPWAFALSPPHGCALQQLGQISQEMSKATGFSQPSLVAYILSDVRPLLPVARLQIQHPPRQLPSGDFLVRPEVALTFHAGFVTSDQLKALNRRVRQAFGQAKAKGLSDEDWELLKLINERGGVPPRGTMAWWEDRARELSVSKGTTIKPDKLRMRYWRLKKEKFSEASLLNGLAQAMDMLPAKQNTGQCGL
jgi:hypothetical protein